MHYGKNSGNRANNKKALRTRLIEDQRRDEMIRQFMQEAFASGRDNGGDAPRRLIEKHVRARIIWTDGHNQETSKHLQTSEYVPHT